MMVENLWCCFDWYLFTAWTCTNHLLLIWLISLLWWSTKVSDWHLLIASPSTPSLAGLRQAQSFQVDHINNEKRLMAQISYPFIVNMMGYSKEPASAAGGWTTCVKLVFWLEMHVVKGENWGWHAWCDTLVTDMMYNNEIIICIDTLILHDAADHAFCTFVPVGWSVLDLQHAWEPISCWLSCVSFPPAQQDITRSWLLVMSCC